MKILVYVVKYTLPFEFVHADCTFEEGSFYCVSEGDTVTKFPTALIERIEEEECGRT